MTNHRRIEIPSEIPLIGQKPKPLAMIIMTHDAPWDTPCEANLPGKDEHGNDCLIKHVWGGKSKRLAIAARLISLVDWQGDIFSEVAVDALRMADALIKADKETAEKPDA